MNEVYVAIYQDPSFDNRIELHNSCFLTIEEGMLLLEDEIIGAWIPAGDGIVIGVGKEVQKITISRLSIQRL